MRGLNSTELALAAVGRLPAAARAHIVDRHHAAIIVATALDHGGRHAGRDCGSCAHALTVASVIGASPDALALAAGVLASDRVTVGVLLTAR